MAIDPNIILSGNQMAQPRLPDVNAMMQTRTAGMENIYNIEQARAEQAKTAQKEQEAEALKALSPAIAAAFSDPSDAGLDAALALVPPQYQSAAKAQLDQIRALPDINKRKALIRAGLVQDEAGRTLLAQLEPTAAQRMTADIQRGQLELSKAELAQRRAEANKPETMTPYQQAQIDIEREKLRRGETPSADYTTVETAEGIFLLDKNTGKMIPAMAGAPATGEGPIDVGQPPQVLQSAAKGKETAEEVKKRLSDEKRAKDVEFAIGELENAMKEGGLIDQATGSYLGNLIDTAVQLFPVATYGAVANARMKPIADLALKLVPRFEGPQSDKDTQSYKDAAGDLANPNLAPSVKKAAADQIVKLLKKYNGQFEYGGGAGGGAIDFNDLGD